MDEIKPHHWITSVGRMSRRKPPKQCQPAAYYDQQAIDTLRAEVEKWRRQAQFETDVAANAISRAERAEVVLDQLTKVLGPSVPKSVTDSGAQCEWQIALDILGAAKEFA